MKLHIQEKLSQIIQELKNDNAIDKEIQIRIMVENTKDKNHGDYATNIAMLLSKPMKMSPLNIANLLLSKFENDDKISKTEIAGPGFINFYVNKNFLEEQINNLLTDNNFGVKQSTERKTIVIDYSSPNVAKEMAVHHIRSTVIGDSVVRIPEFLGNKVIRANHIGDWGTQFGMLIAYLEKKENENANSLELSDLEAFYREAKICYDEDENFAKKTRSYVVKHQSGDKYCHSMWEKLVKITMDQNQEIYILIDTSLTEIYALAQHFAIPIYATIVEDLVSKNLAVRDDGAMVVYLDQFKDKDGKPRGVIVQKKDGGYLYTTTDIACTKYRCEHFHANRIICFADSRQHEHLLMAWNIASLAGYVPNGVSLEHGAFGMMLGKDGKPFKTRTGGTVKLKDLLDEAEVRAATLIQDRNSDLTAEEKNKVIHTIAMGAVKYADLSKNRTTDYIFDWDNMLAFEGNTSPYLQYAYTRIQSIFRRAGADADLGPVQLTEAAEEALAQKLVLFNDAVQNVAAKGMPHLLCTYLYELSGLFMSFYEACPINKEGVEPAAKASRLTLCAATARVIKQGLALLGIQVLERM